MLAAGTEQATQQERESFLHLYPPQGWSGNTAPDSFPTGLALGPAARIKGPVLSLK